MGALVSDFGLPDGNGIDLIRMFTCSNIVRSFFSRLARDFIRDPGLPASEPGAVLKSFSTSGIVWSG